MLDLGLKLGQYFVLMLALVRVLAMYTLHFANGRHHPLLLLTLQHQPTHPLLLILLLPPIQPIQPIQPIHHPQPLTHPPHPLLTIAHVL